jgi:signal transduction histidine kinase
VGGIGEGGRVLLHTDGDARTARIVVSDDGPGMTPEAIEHAFDRFGGHERPDDDRALGLGLPIARQFAEAHGGTIQLLSEPGEGTLLIVELPR